MAEQLVEIGLRCAGQFVHQRPAVGRRNQDFGGAGGAMAVRILTRLVDIEFMVGVLDGGNGVAEAGDQSDHLNEQRRLATAAPTRQTHDLHGVNPLSYRRGR